MPVRRPLLLSIELATVFAAACLGTMMLRTKMSPDAKAGSKEFLSDHGRRAYVPEEIPSIGLRDVIWRVIREVSEDRVTLIAAGVTFYLLLAIFPALAALVSLYGLVADPNILTQHLRMMAGLLPPGAFDLFSEQLAVLVAKPHGALGATFFLGLIIALWSTHSGTLALFDAMNVAYEEREKRDFIRLNLIALLFTLCALTLFAIVIGLMAVLPGLLAYIWLDHYEKELILLARWPIFILLAMCAILTIYRFGPSREPARLRWMTWGAILTMLAWFAMSFALAYYLDHFANYNATYGTFGALIGFLIWMWLSVTILIIGAELNAELEHQTQKDTTTGTPLPIGLRGAYVADTVGEAMK